MTGAEDVWIPLVDEPIGALVTELVEEDTELKRLVADPRRLRAFKTFAYIQAGIVLGRLLVEEDVDRVEELLEAPEYRREVARELRAVAEQLAADAGDVEPAAPDDEVRSRFRAFARERLESLP